ncbi:MAG: hypothetical protein LBS23_02260 [Holosporaceae bacterium]|jgi:hypothetical protein|nr:hypothetical protein [Holosporaceae bacterium]
MNIIAALTLFAAFLVGLFLNDALQYIFRLKKNSDTSNNRLRKSEKTNKIPPSEENSSQILGEIGYYFASNDEKNMQVYSATPLQDIDPKDLA